MEQVQFMVATAAEMIGVKATFAFDALHKAGRGKRDYRPKWVGQWDGADFLYWPIWNGRLGRQFRLSDDERRALKRSRTYRPKLHK